MGVLSSQARSSPRVATRLILKNSTVLCGSGLEMCVVCAGAGD